MRALAQIRSFWRNLVSREQVEREMDDELRAYVDLIADEYARAGMSPGEARRRALVATGGVERVKEATRDAWVGSAVATAHRELRHAVRALRRSPVFLAVAVLVLALGIGGATAVFTVVNASLLRPLPGVAEPERLITVERIQGSHRDETFNYADFRDLSDAPALAGLAGFNGTSWGLKDATGSARVWVSFVTDDFFRVLGVQPAAGRLFSSGAAGNVVVLGYDLWQKRYGGTREIIGSMVTLEGNAYAVVGVAPPGFIGAMKRHRMEVWITMVADGRPAPILGDMDLASRRGGLLRLVGRLAPGKSVADAQRDLSAIASHLAATYPTNRERSVTVFAGAGMTADERVETTRLPRLLGMAVALLLLIACGNVAGLSLVRAAARTRELATRLALGASRAALVRQAAMEAALIAAGAGALGVLVARALVRSATLVDTVVPIRGLDVSLDHRVLGVAIAASLLTALLVSLLPALQLFRLSPSVLLKDGGGGAIRRARGQRFLVAGQVGASLVLLGTAAIVFSTFQRILATHADADPDGLAYKYVGVRATLDKAPRYHAFFRAVLERAVSEPGIARATLTSSVPPLPWSAGASIFRRGEEPTREELTGREGELGLRVNVVWASDGWFDVMRVPILTGRSLAPQDDDEHSERVAVVSQRLARELWPGQDPLGQLIAWPSAVAETRPIRVVGVAADTRDLALATPAHPTMYLAWAEQTGRSLVLAVRGRDGARIDPALLQRIVTDVDPSAAPLGGKTLGAELRQQLAPRRRASAWIGVFAAFALLLAAIGLYGVVTQSVLQRTRELALRSALGATPRGILANVLRDGLGLAALGAVAGTVGSVAAFKVLQSLFTGVQPVDVRLAAISSVFLATALLAAAYVPARRASRLNPVDALRTD